MSDLVEMLTKGLHPIAAERAASARELKKHIERGFVLLKFPDTKGGTELGSRLDMEKTRLDGADFEGASGSVHLVGNLTLDYEKVQIVADIDVASLKGTGCLVLVDRTGSAVSRGESPPEPAAQGTQPAASSRRKKRSARAKVAQA